MPPVTAAAFHAPQVVIDDGHVAAGDVIIATDDVISALGSATDLRQRIYHTVDFGRELYYKVETETQSVLILQY